MAPPPKVEGLASDITACIGNTPMVFLNRVTGKVGLSAAMYQYVTDQSESVPILAFSLWPRLLQSSRSQNHRKVSR